MKQEPFLLVRQPHCRQDGVSLPTSKTWGVIGVELRGDALHARLPPGTAHEWVGEAACFVVMSTLSCRALLLNRSEEHTSELQSHLNLVCRLLLEKKKQIPTATLLSDP